MDIIHLLPDSVANQIAAGEVIQRPASCLKELVENSLDAGASTVQILLYDAGRTMMQVTDDGNGMSETDARMAFERHATSKIRTADDLFSLHTMGFRGEALASICAVAQVEVMTRREDDETGTRLQINGSEVIEQEPCSCAKGTTIKVKNLFYNVPARRRFLKTDGTELRNILHEFYRIVLVNPQCHFLLAHQDEILFDLPACNTKTRIEQVFGKGHNKQFTAGLVEVKSETELVSVYGFVGKPEISAKQAQQYFFVNNRYMRHPYFHKAVLTAYQGMLQPDMQPPYFIYFDIRPDAIDVNIHPTKTEIKFADEQSVWQILLATVREALGKFNVVPSLDFENSVSVDIPVMSSRMPLSGQPPITVDSDYNPFTARTAYPPSFDNKDKAPAGWERLYEATAAPNVGGETEQVLFDADISSLVPWQVADKYIALPLRTGLLLIDQHRAHVCVLFAELQQLLSDRRLPVQQLLFPETVELTAAECSMLEEAHDDLDWLGFDVARFSPAAYYINGVPAMLGESNAAVALRHILDGLSASGLSARDDRLREMAASLAEDTAVTAGKAMSEAEMRSLIERLFATAEHNFTPKGKRVMAMLSIQDVEKMF